MRKIRHFVFMLLALITSATAFAQKPVSDQVLHNRSLEGQQISANAAVPMLLEALDETIVAAQPSSKKNVRFEGEEDVLVTPPAGLVTKDLKITWMKDGYTTTGDVKVGVDGTDIYIQGLCTEVPDGWAKGTMTPSTTAGTYSVSFECGQYLGTDDSDEYNVLKYYLGSFSTSSQPYPDAPMTMTYYANDDALVGTGYISIAKQSENMWTNRHYYCYNARIYMPQALAEPPSGATQTTWTFSTSTYTSQTYGNYSNEEAKMVVDGNDVWVQGICQSLPNAWMKGTKGADGSLTFSGIQYVGLNGTQPTYMAVITAHLA